MGLLSKHDAVAGLTLPYQDVPTPEIGADAAIRVRCITALQKDQYEIGFWQGSDSHGKPVYSAEGSRARLLAMACVQEDGTPLFTEPEAREFRADVADRLFDVAQRISGLLAGVEELKKALGAAQAGASRTT